MIGTIRKHQQWLWVIIILAIIVSFVVYFSPNQTGLFDDEGSYNFGTIKDRPITRDEFRSAQSEIVLFYFLRFGKWPSKDELQQTGFDLERETYNRILLIEKLKQLNINVTTEATAKWIAEVFRGKDDQTFPMERYEAFVKNELTPNRLTTDDFYRFARHQIGQQHLISVYGLGGKLIAPQEAESFYRRLNEPVATEAVLFSATNYLAKVSATPEVLGQFYTNNMAEYRLPERVQANYVKWEATNFLADADKELGKITNLSQRIEAVYFQKGGTNEYKDETGKPLSLEAAKNKIKEEERRQIALVSAHKKTAEFLEELAKGHDEKNPFSPDDLEKLAKAKGLDIKTTPPFDQRTTTNQLDLPAAFMRAAFALRADEPEDKPREMLFTFRPIVGKDAVYAIGLKQRFPSEIQPFEKVREKVTEDYRADQSLKLARNAGIAFEKTLTNGIAQGKTFLAIAKEADVKPISLPPFTLSARSLPELPQQVNLETLQNVASSLVAGQTSGFIATSDGGFVLHLKAKLPVDEAQLKTELPDFLARQREQRMSAAFSEWFQKLPQELKLVLPPKAPDGKK
ncbi:MAG: SurA N-terminal domain-containing protein [Verrucomicrobiota bacterium]